MADASRNSSGSGKPIANKEAPTQEIAQVRTLTSVITPDEKRILQAKDAKTGYDFSTGKKWWILTVVALCQ